MPSLGVNIDHIATLREARKASYPDPAEALPILVKCGVEQVTLHLREDRRHIRDRDLERVIASHLLPVNMELAPTEEMLNIALTQVPGTCTFVPERREEITTEGGLDLALHESYFKRTVALLRLKKIRVSFFIDPDPQQILLAQSLGGEAVEFHTGTYCEAYGTKNEKKEYQRLIHASKEATSKGLKVFAGHGLNLVNLAPLTAIREIEEYNIGHSIIARAVFIGLEAAVREIQEILGK